MPTIDLQGTKFTFTILPLKLLAGDFKARVEMKVENEYVSYAHIEKEMLSGELEEWIFSMFRLLAGAYKREYNIVFENTGFAVDLYPHTKNGEEVSRAERRKEDCIMALRLLMRTKKGGFLGGVYTLLLHREDIFAFATILREEYDKIFVKRVHGRGKILFAGVSPLGYKGCNYWYLDASGEVKAGEYVWVQMGSHNTEQIVYVDGVRYFTEETAPYPIHRVKQVLRKATEEELKNCKE